jgi:hypothetical protein
MYVMRFIRAHLCVQFVEDDERAVAVLPDDPVRVLVVLANYRVIVEAVKVRGLVQQLDAEQVLSAAVSLGHGLDGVQGQLDVLRIYPLGVVTAAAAISSHQSVDSQSPAIIQSSSK